MHVIKYTYIYICIYLHLYLYLYIFMFLFIYLFFHLFILNTKKRKQGKSDFLNVDMYKIYESTIFKTFKGVFFHLKLS